MPGQVTCAAGWDAVHSDCMYPANPCTNTCNFASDDVCDDGGPGAQYLECKLSSDCIDCGPRVAPPPLAASPPWSPMPPSPPPYPPTSPLPVGFVQVSLVELRDALRGPAGGRFVLLPGRHPLDGESLVVPEGMYVRIDGSRGAPTIIDGGGRSLGAWRQEMAAMEVISSGGPSDDRRAFGSRLFEVHGHLELNGLQLTGGHATKGGGVMVRPGGSVQMYDVHLADCIASSTDRSEAVGGAVYGWSAEVTLVNVTITQCAALAFGGGHSVGGAISVSGAAVGDGSGEGLSRLTLIDVLIADCAASNPRGGMANGGAVNTLSGNATLVDVTIANCSSSTTGNGKATGGALTAHSSHTTLRNTRLVGCTATASGDGESSGGAVRSAYGVLMLQDVHVVSCVASSRGDGYAAGGAVYSLMGKARLLNVGIADCTALTAGSGRANGGAIYSFNGGHTTLVGTTITRCAARAAGGGDGGGGGLFSSFGTVALDNVSFADCIVFAAGGGSVAGGALYAKDGIATLVDISVTRCTASASAGSYAVGGALCFWRSTTTVQKATINGCTASTSNDGDALGGGVYSSVSNTTLSDVHLDDCTATSSGGGLVAGGAVHSEPGNATLVNVTMDHCTASSFVRSPAPPLPPPLALPPAAGTAAAIIAAVSAAFMILALATLYYCCLKSHGSMWRCTPLGRRRRNEGHILMPSRQLVNAQRPLAPSSMASLPRASQAVTSATTAADSARGSSLGARPDSGFARLLGRHSDCSDDLWSAVTSDGTPHSEGTPSACACSCSALGAASDAAADAALGATLGTVTSSEAALELCRAPNVRSIDGSPGVMGTAESILLGSAPLTMPSSESTTDSMPGMPHTTPGESAAIEGVAEEHHSPRSAIISPRGESASLSAGVGSHSVVIESVLGRGGFATVWRGKWMFTEVAVKVFHNNSSPKMMSKFQLEAQTLRKLRHPNICYFLDTCMLDGAPVIVLELLNGGTLGEHLGLSATQGVALQAASPAEADEPPDCADSMTSSTCPATGKWGATASSELLRLAKDVALGLHYLHANGVTHRDVKNANVMIDRGQTIRAKLCDFGISSLKSVRPEQDRARSFASIGTLRYLPPEMVNLMASATGHYVPDDQLDIVHHARVDVYSFGLMLHEIMHGAVFLGELSPMAVAMKASAGLRPPLALRPELAKMDALIVACWHEVAARRPSMERVVDALNSYQL